MNSDYEIIFDHPAAFKMRTPASRLPRPYGRAFQYILAAAVYGWGAVSTHATLALPTSQAHSQSLAAFTDSLSVVHRLEFFYPLLGVLAAMASTWVLHRRRLAQMEALAVGER